MSELSDWKLLDDEAGWQGGGEMSYRHRRPGPVLATLLTAGLLLFSPALGQAAFAAPTDPDPVVTADTTADTTAPESTDPDTAAAADTPACLQPTNGYAPRGVCQLTILRAQSACVGGAPVLEYAVQPEGTPNTTVTITWQNPGGADVVYAGLPLSGRVLWPGTVIENGKVVDWPGWTTNPDGTFTEGDEYNWVRPSVQLLFEVNPSATTLAVYPPARSSCANPTLITGTDGGVDAEVPGTPVIDQPTFRSGVLAAGTTETASRAAFRSGVLAATGVDTTPELRTAGLLLGAGVLTLVLAKLAGRRRVTVES